LLVEIQTPVAVAPSVLCTGLRRIATPFRGVLALFLTGTVIRQALLVLGGYTMVWAFRLCVNDRGIDEWLLVLALILFDGAYIRFDQALNTMFASRISFPLFGRLRTAALEKVFEMPVEWHQEQTSGALVSKVNNGVGRVVQTGETMSRELCPSMIRTAFSLAPLLIFSVQTAPVLGAALLVFGWLTWRENADVRGSAAHATRTTSRTPGSSPSMCSRISRSCSSARPGGCSRNMPACNARSPNRV
jgi:ABC-type multidrug transport system fused ATPase/permease subunit